MMKFCDWFAVHNLCVFGRAVRFSVERRRSEGRNSIQQVAEVRCWRIHTATNRLCLMARVEISSIVQLSSFFLDD